MFVYLVALMTAITCFSHGSQDLYPDFLRTVHGFSALTISNLAILYNVGAIAGGARDRPSLAEDRAAMEHSGCARRVAAGAAGMGFRRVA